jgi:hypothetical protein
MLGPPVRTQADTIPWPETIVLKSKLATVNPWTHEQAIKVEMLLRIVTVQGLTVVLIINLVDLTHEMVVELVNCKCVVNVRGLHLKLERFRMIIPNKDSLGLSFDGFIDLVLFFVEWTASLLSCTQLGLVTLGHLFFNLWIKSNEPRGFCSSTTG